MQKISEQYVTFGNHSSILVKTSNKARRMVSDSNLHRHDHLDAFLPGESLCVLQVSVLAMCVLPMSVQLSNGSVCAEVCRLSRRCTRETECQRLTRSEKLPFLSKLCVCAAPVGPEVAMGRCFGCTFELSALCFYGTLQGPLLSGRSR
jgi:hypothetical protein